MPGFKPNNVRSIRSFKNRKNHDLATNQMFKVVHVVSRMDNELGLDFTFICTGGLQNLHMGCIEFMLIAEKFLILGYVYSVP